MKKFIYLILILFFAVSCAKTVAHREYFDGATGNKIAVEDLSMSRPIFAAMGAGSSSPSGTITMNSASSISVEQLMSMALQGYSQYISGGLANKALNMQNNNATTPPVGPIATPANPSTGGTTP
jgi:hypothetical protein